MPKGRPPKPAHLRLVEGNPGKRPIKAEPRSAPLGPPPEALASPYVEAWHELVAAAPDGVLRNTDRFLLELAARLIVQVRTMPACPAAMATQLRACLTEIGMSPSSRARLAVAPPRARNPFDAD